MEIEIYGVLTPSYSDLAVTWHCGRLFVVFHLHLGKTRRAGVWSGCWCPGVSLKNTFGWGLVSCDIYLLSAPCCLEPTRGARLLTWYYTRYQSFAVVALCISTPTFSCRPEALESRTCPQLAQNSRPTIGQLTHGVKCDCTKHVKEKHSDAPKPSELPVSLLQPPLFRNRKSSPDKYI